MTNFGILYGAGARTIKAQLWKQQRIEVSEAEAQWGINGFKRAFPDLMQWQERLIASVVKTGEIVLPVTGHWLSFAKPKSRQDMDKAILNFPIQCIAANICLAAQAAVIRVLRDRRAGVACLNIYDAVVVDTVPMNRDSLTILINDLRASMGGNWYVGLLVKHYWPEGRSQWNFPVDAKVMRE